MSALRSAVLAAATAIAAILIGGAAAPPAMWASRPSDAQVEAARPAGQAQAIGRAAMTCKARADGAISDCRLRLDSPAGAGFGAALLALAPQYRLNLAAPHAPAAGQEVWASDVWPAPGRGPGDRQADWVRKPTQSEILKVWPAAAWAKGEGGQGTISCLVSLQGAVSDCRVDEEDPPGQGVGAAALGLAPHFRLTTWTAEGLPTVGGTIGIPLRYEMKGPAPKG